MLGHPAFVTRHDGCDAQCEAFFAEQGVAAVAGAVAPDLAGFWKMGDVFIFHWCAWPGDVVFAVCERLADGMQAWHEEAVVAESIEHFLAGAGHDLHVEGDVWAVGDLHADAGRWAVDRSHAKWDDVEGASLHGAAIERLHFFLEFCWRIPVVGWAGVFFFFACDEGAFFNAGDVGDVGTEQVAVWMFFLVELDYSVVVHEICKDRFLLRVGSVKPDDFVRLAESWHLIDPGQQRFIVSHDHSP